MPGGRTGGPGGIVRWAPDGGGGGGPTRGELGLAAVTPDWVHVGNAGATGAAETSDLLSLSGTVRSGDMLGSVPSLPTTR